ncbi:MAG: EFR1 family ferrodoxin [Eubacteriaceae bacterium]
MKKVNTLYFSATDTTKKIVSAIACGFGEISTEYDITLPPSRGERHSFSEDDIVVVGVPVYAGRVPEFLVDYFKSIKGNYSKAVCVVLYGNRDYDDALLELKNIINQQGFEVIAAGAFIGEHSYTANVAQGRPDIQDIQVAIEFGRSIKNKLKNTSEIVGELQVKGNFPYSEGMASAPSIGPTTDINCIQCGKCAQYCPTEAIDDDDCRLVDATKCIKCCSCVKRCPKDSKELMVKTIIKRLEDNFTKLRKEPEVFI